MLGLLSKLLRRFRKTPRKAKRLRACPVLEPLEARTVLSTIRWLNRGSAASDSDGFNAVFGANAASARTVVDGVIRAWERLVADLRYTDGSNTFALTLSTTPSRRGLGSVSYFASRYDGAGRPMAAEVVIDSGTDGRGAGWFLDQTPDDAAEFRGTVVNAFAGNATPGGPAVGRVDYFTVVAHELSHVLGLTADSRSALQQDPNRYVVATGQTDAYFKAGRLFTFTGPSVKALLTSYNRFSPNGDFGRPLHTAEPVNSYTSGSVTYAGSQDTNNAVYEYSRRYLPSLLDALILKDAYGYTVMPPQTVGDFYAILDSVTGNLLLRGGATGTSNDTITVDRDGDQLVVSVTIGNPIPGTAVSGALVSRFAAAGVRSITIQAGNGNDTVRLGGAGAGVPVNVELGEGDDTLILGNGSGRLDDLLAGVTVSGQAGTDALLVQDQGGTAGRSFTLTPTGLAWSSGRSVAFGTLEALTVRAGAGADTFTVQGLLGMPVTLNGGPGTDTLNGPNVANGWRVTGMNAGTLDTTVTFANIEGLKGGTADDQFALSASRGVSGGIDGNGGRDVLDYSAYTTPVVVLLAGGQATNVGGGVRNVNNVTGGAGNDLLVGDDRGNELRGGRGNDIIYGQGGDDLLMGDDGDDYLSGGSGRELFLGGLGADRLLGLEGDDLLVGGTTTLDTNAVALRSVLAEWTRLDETYPQRINHLLVGGGLNGGVLLTAAVVRDDAARDELTGSADADWFWATLSGAARDALLDVAASERIN